MGRMNVVCVIMILLGACQPASPDYPESNCAEATEFVQEVENRKGLLSRMEDSDKYAISYHFPGTYDVIEVGVVCSILADFSLPEGGEEPMEVIFSGYYWKYTNVPPSLPAGSAAYYLEVTAISQE
ncbi:hypothetical protein [Echinicola rosea]|nr:hypothetical protein [Echinicola rosea]